MILYFNKFLILALLLCCTQAAHAAAYVVVSNNLRGRSFSGSEVRQILLGEITSINNGRVRLIYPSYTSSAILAICKFVGKNNVRDLKSYWSKMIFTGRGNPPETADNEAELKRLLLDDNSIGVATQAEGMNVVYTISD